MPAKLLASNWKMNGTRAALPQIAEIAAGLVPGADCETISLLYGGSVNATNAARIFAIADVDGGLVGGASLRAADFLPIHHALSGA